jgi:hypothetical protein
MLTPEQIARLTPEELVIAEKWEKEKEERDVVFNEMQAALKDNDLEGFQSAMDKMAEGLPIYCEHERSIWSGCMACDELEQKLYPEFFMACKECEETVLIEECNDGVCMDCYSPE